MVLMSGRISRMRSAAAWRGINKSGVNRTQCLCNTTAARLTSALGRPPLRQSANWKRLCRAGLEYLSTMLQFFAWQHIFGNVRHAAAVDEGHVANLRNRSYLKRETSSKSRRGTRTPQALSCLETTLGGGEGHLCSGFRVQSSKPYLPMLQPRVPDPRRSTLADDTASGLQQQ